MNRCRWITESGVQCGRPFNHSSGHENGTLTTPRDVWSEPKYPVDVPVFTIKASDPCACAIIRLWCIITAALKNDKGEQLVSKEKIDGAHKRIEEFKEFQARHGVKVPD